MDIELLKKRKATYEEIYKLAQGEELPPYACYLKESALNGVLVADLSLQSGIEIPDRADLDTGFYRFNDYLTLSKYYAGCNKSISWSDDGRQPDEGWYLVISFPCGAYTLHPDYPTETFDAFFEKLKSYGPDYSDTVNHCLYFKLTEENRKACSVYNDFKAIKTEYHNKVQAELNRKRIAEMYEEIAKLEGK